MTVISHQPVRRFVIQVLAILFILFITTISQAAQVTLAWDPNDPAPDGYRVFLHIEGEAYDYASPAWPQAGDDPLSTTCTIDNLAEDTQYYFVVRAYAGDEISGDSNEVIYRTEAQTPVSYTLSAAAGAHGSISPGTVTVDAGGSQTFTITPDSNYHVADVLVDGQSVGPVSSYTFNQVSADHTITAAFAVNTVSQADQVTLAWDPNDPAPDGYRVFQHKEGETYDFASPVWPQAGDNPQSTTCTIGNLAEDTVYYFVVRAYVGNEVSGDSNEVVYRTGAQSPVSYTLSVAAGAHGSISPGTVTVDAGGSQTFTITPDSNYHVADVLVDGQSVGPVSSYTFSQVSADHTITAAFAIDAFTISAAADAHGSISPAGSVTLNYGSSQTYTISPDAGYHVSDVLVDSQSIGAVQSYTFTNVAAPHAIEAFFQADVFTISSAAGPGGTISPSGQIQVAGGANQGFILTADEGYKIEDLVVDGIPMGTQNSYTFSNVQADHAIEATFIRSNQTPIADAGPDQVMDEAQVVTLSGLNSHDPDDGIVRFQWSQIQGDPVVLSSPEQETTTFTTPNVDMAGQSLVFELTVTDSEGATAKDTCIVNVTWVNEAPVAGAGADQSVSEGSMVTLDATTSMDADDGISSYSWLQVQGPPVVLSDPQSATPHYTAPDVRQEGASLIFELTVTDAGGLQDTDACTVTVTWKNIEPTADAGPDQQVAAGDEVTLDGSRSVDPDGASLLYQWRQTDGPPVVLSDATAVSPVFTVPLEGFDDTLLVFQLTVTDDGGLQGVDTCQVAVQAASNADTEPPVLTILNPAQDYIEVSTNKIGIAGTATDNTAVSQVVWVNDRGQSETVSGTESWYIDQLHIHRGTNTCTITAYDAAGNSQSKTITIQWNSPGK